MKVGVILFLLIFCFVLQQVSAQSVVQTLPPVKLSTCTSLVQLCSNCTFVNLSYIQIPDKTIIQIQQPMTSLGSGYFNYTFCNTSQVGQYITNGIANPDGTNLAWNYDFEVNPIGRVFTNSQAILYFLIFSVSFVLFLLFAIAGLYLPSNNKRDQMTGYIIAVENLKYVKMLCWALCYVMLMLMFYFGWMISFGYLDLSFLGNIFNFGFYALAVGALPLFIVGVYVVISNWVRDSQVADALSMHLRIQ